MSTINLKKSIKSMKFIFASLSIKFAYNVGKNIDSKK